MLATITTHILKYGKSINCPYSNACLVVYESAIPRLNKKEFVKSNVVGLFSSGGGSINIIHEDETYSEGLEFYKSWLENAEIELEEYLRKYVFKVETKAMIITDNEEWGHFLILLQPSSN